MSNETIIPAGFPTQFVSVRVQSLLPDKAPTISDISADDHTAIAWKIDLETGRASPVLYPPLYDPKRTLFVGVVMPDGHMRNIDGTDVRADLMHAKESALREASRLWHRGELD